MTETLWESEGLTADGKPFMTVKRARGYFYYAERGGVDSIAFILFDREKELIGLVREAKPPLDESMKAEASLITAAGGSIDSDKTPREICITEIYEECGYAVSDNDVYAIGTTMVSTQASEMCYGYIADVTGLKPLHNDEPETELVWLTPRELFNNNDMKAIWIYSQAQYIGVV